MAKVSSFTFQGVTYTSMKDYCTKKYVDYKEVASFSNNGSVLSLTSDELLIIVKRHHRFFDMSDIEFMGLKFDSLDHLFFALGLSHTSYLSLLDTDDKTSLLGHLEQVYKKRDNQLFIFKGVSYLTIQNACFELGVNYDERMETMPKEQLELYISDCLATIAYYKIARKNALAENKAVPEIEKVSFGMYLSKDGNPPAIVKCQLPPIEHQPRPYIPELDFSDMPEIDYSPKPSASAQTGVSSTGKRSYVPKKTTPVEFDGKKFEKTSMLYDTYKVSQSVVGLLKKDGYTLQEAMYILLNRRTLEDAFPNSFTGRRYPTFRAFLSSLKLLLNDINKDLCKGFLPDGVAYARNLEQLHSPRNQVKKVVKEKVKVSTVKAVSKEKKVKPSESKPKRERKPSTKQTGVTSKKGTMHAVLFEGRTFSNRTQLCQYHEIDYSKLMLLALKGYKTDEGAYILINRNALEKEFPKTVSNVVVKTYRVFLNLVELTMEEANNRIKDGIISDTSAYIDELVANRYAKFEKNAITKRLTVKKKRVAVDVDKSTYIEYRGRYYKSVAKLASRHRIEPESLERFMVECNNDVEKALANCRLEKAQLAKTQKNRTRRAKVMNFIYDGVAYTSLIDFSEKNKLTYSYVTVLHKQAGSLDAFLEGLYSFEGRAYLSLSSWAKGVGVTLVFLRDLIDLVGLERAKEVLSDRIKKVA